MGFDIENLLSFTASSCNRRVWIQEKLSSFGLEGKIISLGEAQHILVKYPKDAYSPMFFQKTIVVHYDRVANTQGANDNSAAVLQVLDFAKRLVNYGGTHNIRIFFSDKEEVKTGVEDLGAFGIADLYRRLCPQNDFVFVFDCCGRGTVPIICDIDTAKSSKSFQDSYKKFHRVCCAMLCKCFPQNWLCLPVPYSDNAAFIAKEIPSVCFTLLPQKEASQYLFDIQQDESLRHDIVNNKVKKEKLPLSWQLFHTQQDNIDTLTKESWKIMQTLLDAICSLKILT